MKHKRSIPALLVSLFLGLGILVLFAGCGDDSDAVRDQDRLEGGQSMPPGGPSQPHAPPGVPQGKPKREVLIRVQDEDSAKPVPGAGVRLFFAPVKKPNHIQYQDSSTTIEGEARFEIPESTRLMVRTEYTTENLEFVMAPEGLTEREISVPTTFAVSGSVRGPDGEGVPGASVFLARFSPGRELADKGIPLPGSVGSIDHFRRNYGFDMETEVTTGEDGGFDTLLKTSQVLLACAYADGLMCTDWRLVSFDTTKGRYEPVIMDLRPAAQLDITLYDARNRIMPESMVLITETEKSKRGRKNWEKVYYSYTAGLRSGPDGRVEARVPAGIDLTVENRLLFDPPAEGEAWPDPVQSRALMFLSLEPGESRSIIALPPRTVRLKGMVRDGEGNPLPGTRVRFPVNSVEAGTQGEFTLLVAYNIHQRMSYFASKPGFKPQSDQLPVIEEGKYELPLEITLERSHDLVVTAPPEVERLWLILPPRSATDPVRRLTGAERLWETGSVFLGQPGKPGTFRFEGVEPCRVTLLAQKGRFHISTIQDVAIEANEDFESRIEIGLAQVHFPEAATLRGVVGIPDGMRPQHIEVTLMRNDLNGVRRWNPFLQEKVALGWGGCAASCEDGGFAMGDLAPGRYSVAATLFEWDMRVDTYQEIEIREGEQEIRIDEFDPDALGDLCVRLRDGDGRPLPGIGLLLLDPVDSPLGRSGFHDYLSFTDEEGSLILENLLPGRYGISMSQTDGVGYLLDARARVEPGACTEVTIELR